MAIITATSMASTGTGNPVSVGLTDLHTHILPGVDDGAETIDESVKMLRLQKTSGVDRVALTPHFYPLREEIQAFLDKRQSAYEELLPNWDDKTMPQLCLGAEVHYSPELVEYNLHDLTIGQGDYLLLELSDTMFPAHIEQVLALMRDQGIKPILAHVERCSYFREEPGRLFRLIEKGALAQISAKALISKKNRKFADICLQKNVAHIVASDIHEAGEGERCLGSLLVDVEEIRILRAETFARAVWDNSQPPVFAPSSVKRTLFGYV